MGVRASQVTRLRLIVGVVAAAVIVGAAVMVMRDRPSDADASRPVATDASTPGERNQRLPKKAYLRRACELPPKWVRYIRRGWSPGRERDHDLVIVPKRGNYMGTAINASHSGPYAFLQRVPLVFFGPGFIRPAGSVNLEREVTIADVAPTFARFVGQEMNTGSSQSLDEILVQREGRPKLVFVAMIDGGGWNALKRWPGRWPNIARLMKEGASVEDVVVGSSPSITPATHTNLSTGTFPRYHGVTAIAVRNDEGRVVGAFSGDGGKDPRKIDPLETLRLPTFNDLWDVENGNAPKMGALIHGTYPLGMLGAGAAHEGGDKDVLAIYAFSRRGWTTTRPFYSLPRYVNEEVEGPERYIDQVDRADGRADRRWRGHEIAPLSATPALPPWQNRVTQEVLEREGFGDDALTDFFYVNYKSPDAAGHEWNMIAPEQGDVIEAVDEAIGDMAEWLDANVGRENYVLLVTADHGQTPIDMGGWAISRREIISDINQRSDGIDNGEGIVERTSASSFFMNKREMQRNRVTAAEISSFLDGYTIGDNIAEGDEVREGFEQRLDERIFDAVFPGGKIGKVVDCTGALDR